MREVPRPQSASEESAAEEASERSVLGTIRLLHSGDLSGASLSTQDRRRVVEHLWSEGYSVPETSDILKVSERTVQRDRRSIREANAVERTPALVGETVGALMRHAEGSVARLRRIARERDAEASTRIDAERASWEILKEMTEMLQALSYLPTAAQEVRGQVTHTVAPSFEQLRAELDQIGRMLEESGVEDPAFKEEAIAVTRELERLALADRIRSLSTQSPPETHDDR